MKYALVNLPLLGSTFQRLFQKIERDRGFSNSQSYWINRYEIGGNSGGGSYNKLAQFKAESINTFISKKDIKTVIEFGCGDGNQLHYANYTNYIGFDISPRAIKICRETFESDKSKNFYVLKPSQAVNVKAELALSLDVIFHLTEDDIFALYMRTLFETSEKFVCIYSSNTDEQKYHSFSHVKHRNFSKWIELNCPEWRLIQKISNPYPYNGNDEESSFSDFYFYANKQNS